MCTNAKLGIDDAAVDAPPESVNGDKGRESWLAPIRGPVLELLLLLVLLLRDVDVVAVAVLAAVSAAISAGATAVARSSCISTPFPRIDPTGDCMVDLGAGPSPPSRLGRSATGGGGANCFSYGGGASPSSLSPSSVGLAGPAYHRDWCAGRSRSLKARDRPRCARRASALLRGRRGGRIQRSSGFALRVEEHGGAADDDDDTDRYENPYPGLGRRGGAEGGTAGAEA